jgi:hypothetical protein
MTVVAKIAIGVVRSLGFALAVLLFFYAASPWTEQGVIPVFGSRFFDSALFGIAGVICVFVNIRLAQGRAWAWWTAVSLSLLTLVLGVLILTFALHLRDDFARSESGFGLGVSVILMTPAVIATVLLILPPVRQRFLFSGRSQSSS